MRTFFIAIVLMLIIACGAIFFPVFSLEAQHIQENITFEMHPSAALAFEYGERHFDGQNPAEYDIARATYFFNKAALLDPTTLYLFHELARIAFLRGDFKTAMADINLQIALHGDQTPNSYYVRGLIEGYMGDYTDSANDYQHFLATDPQNWAGINDYAWVLLKAGRPQDAVVATAYGLKYFPGNPWLLNSNAIGLYEMGLITPARDQAHAALAAAAGITEAQWLHAYPGNDPKIAAEGIAAFQSAVIENMHSIILANASSTVQSGTSHD
jgi:tetratricopeptide (TPR) repeat protein